MVKDKVLTGFYGSSNELLEFRDQSLSQSMNRKLDSGFRNGRDSSNLVGHKYATTVQVPPIQNPSDSTASLGMASDSTEDCDFSDVVLRYISQMLTIVEKHSLPSDSTGYFVDGYVESPVSTLRVPDFLNESDSILQFNKGFEEASKFLPNRNSLIVGLESKAPLLKELKTEARDMKVKVDKKNNRVSFYWIERKETSLSEMK